MADQRCLKIGEALNPIAVGDPGLLKHLQAAPAVLQRAREEPEIRRRRQHESLCVANC